MEHEQQVLSIEELKKSHDFYVITVQILSQRIQFFAEEFDAIKSLIQFHQAMIKALAKKIDALEPKEPKDGQEQV
jgi:hypothetical protein